MQNSYSPAKGSYSSGGGGGNAQYKPRASTPYKPPARKPFTPYPNVKKQKAKAESQAKIQTHVRNLANVAKKANTARKVIKNPIAAGLKGTVSLINRFKKR